jgi:hypothetical protein
MPKNLLIDTDVLIDYLRGQPDAIQYLENLAENILISVITVAELYSGVREGKELQILELFLSTFQIIHVSKEIAIRGGLYRRNFGKSHNVGLADALIAATTEIKDATLVTLNQKHFPMISAVHVPYRKG